MRHWNTRRDTVFRHTRGAFGEAFRQTRDIFKYISIDHKTRSEEYRIKCPVALLHIKDIWHSTDRKKDSIGKLLAKGVALFLSAIFEFPVLVIKSLIVDVITLPVKAVAGFVIDLGELLGNIVGDVASLPAAGMDYLAERPAKESISQEKPSERSPPDPIVEQSQQLEIPAPRSPQNEQSQTPRAEESARSKPGFWNSD